MSSSLDVQTTREDRWDRGAIVRGFWACAGFRVVTTESDGEAVALPRLPGNSSLEELTKRYYASPDNYAVGYALYREQKQRGLIDDALMTARHFSERPGSPAYFHFLEAQCWAAKENWERAWSAWQAFRATARK